MSYIGNSPANIGNYQIVDDISSTFNGVLTTFALTAATQTINPAKSGQLLVSINGVLQEPDDTGTEGFLVSGSNIVFSSAPATGSTFWCVFQGQNVDIGTPSNDTVGLTQLSATGTASSATFLAGDNTWKTVDALPTQATHAGKYLTTDGTVASWDSIAATTFPFYKADGTSDSINITNGTFPFFKADGSADNIGVS